MEITLAPGELMTSRAGISDAFLDEINKAVNTAREMKIRHIIGTIVLKLTSPEGELFVITI